MDSLKGNVQKLSAPLGHGFVFGYICSHLGRVFQMSLMACLPCITSCSFFVFSWHSKTLKVPEPVTTHHCLNNLGLGEAGTLHIPIFANKTHFWDSPPHLSTVYLTIANVYTLSLGNLATGLYYHPSKNLFTASLCNQPSTSMFYGGSLPHSTGLMAQVHMPLINLIHLQPAFHSQHSISRDVGLLAHLVCLIVQEVSSYLTLPCLLLLPIVSACLHLVKCCC